MGGIHAKRIGGGTDNKKLTGNKMVEQMNTKFVTNEFLLLLSSIFEFMKLKNN